MRADFPPALTAQPRARIFAQQPLQQIFQKRIAYEVQWRLLVAYFCFDGIELLVLHEERRETGNHFEDQTAEGPPVRSRSHPAALSEQLRRQIFRRPCNEVIFLYLIYSAAEAKIHQFHKSVFVDQHILWLETKWGLVYSR